MLLSCMILETGNTETTSLRLMVRVSCIQRSNLLGPLSHNGALSTLDVKLQVSVKEATKCIKLREVRPTIACIIHPLHRYFLRASYVLEIVLGSQNILLKKTNDIHALVRLIV